MENDIGNDGFDVSADEKTVESVEKGIETGELNAEDLAVNEPKEETQPDASNVTDDSVDIKGVKYSKDELERAIEKAKNEENWRKSLTEGQQKVAKERKEYQKQLDKLRARNSTDTDLVELIDILEERGKRLDELDVKTKTQYEELQTRNNAQMLENLKRDAKALTGNDYPDLNTTEGKARLDVLSAANPHLLYDAYEFYMDYLKKGGKGKPDLSALNVGADAGEVDEIDEELATEKGSKMARIFGLTKEKAKKYR